MLRTIPSRHSGSIIRLTQAQASSSITFHRQLTRINQCKTARSIRWHHLMIREHLIQSRDRIRVKKREKKRQNKQQLIST